MTIYRDVTCDPVSGTRVIDKTAAGILDVLTTYTGGIVPVADINTSVLYAGGKLSWKPQALKALRNHGWLIDVDKRRHLTTWRLAGTPDEVETYRQRRMTEAYSAAVSIGRMLTQQVTLRPGDAIVAQSNRISELLVITLAGDPAVGKTAAQALADLVPL